MMMHRHKKSSQCPNLNSNAKASPQSERTNNYRLISCGRVLTTKQNPKCNLRNNSQPTQHLNNQNTIHNVPLPSPPLVQPNVHYKDIDQIENNPVNLLGLSVKNKNILR